MKQQSGEYKLCATCEIPIYPDTNGFTPKYCSHECRFINHRISNYHCVQCGSVLDSKRRFCDQTCSDIYTASYNVKCLGCNTTISVNPKYYDGYNYQVFKPAPLYCGENPTIQTCSTFSPRLIHCHECDGIIDRLIEFDGHNFCHMLCKQLYEYRRNNANDPIGILYLIQNTHGTVKYRENIRIDRSFITFDNILKLYESQGGKCAITGVKLTHRVGKKSPYKISLDRIDSNKGYVEGNVHLVAMAANYMKNDFTMDQIEKFIKDFDI